MEYDPAQQMIMALEVEAQELQRLQSFLSALLAEVQLTQNTPAISQTIVIRNEYVQQLTEALNEIQFAASQLMTSREELQRNLNSFSDSAAF